MNQWTLSYSPIVTRENRFLGLHLSISPLPKCRPNLDEVLSEITPFIAEVPGTVLVSARGYPIAPNSRVLGRAPNMVLVLPTTELHDESLQESLQHLHHNCGLRLALHGRSDTPLPRHMIPMFDYALIRETEDRRRKQEPDAPTAYRRIPFITIGDATQDGIDAAFFAGAIAAIGWPQTPAQAPQSLRPSQPPQMTAARFVATVMRRATLGEIQEALSLAPTVEGRLSRLIPLLDPDSESPATIESMLARGGHDALIRIFTIILLISARDYKHLALVYASLVRACLLSEVAPYTQKHGAFLAGAMSLADRITDTSLPSLLDLVQADDEVRGMVLAQSPDDRERMSLVVALEHADAAALQRHLAALHLTQRDVNAALLNALRTANAVIKVFQPD